MEKSGKQVWNFPGFWMECTKTSKEKKYCCTAPILMIASIYVLIDTVSFYMFWYFYVELWSLVNREQRFCTLYKKCFICWRQNLFFHKLDLFCEEDEEDISVCAQRWGLCCWWPSDRVSAIQISGITMRALCHQQPDWAQLITTQRRQRFTVVCFLFSLIASLLGWQWEDVALVGCLCLRFKGVYYFRLDGILFCVGDGSSKWWLRKTFFLTSW